MIFALPGPLRRTLHAGSGISRLPPVANVTKARAALGHANISFTQADPHVAVEDDGPGVCLVS